MTKNFTLIALCATFVLFLLALGNIVEQVDSSEVVVIQYPNGTLKTVTEAGPTFQWFGTATHYPLRSQFSFSAKDDQGHDKDESILIRFNDGGHASVSGVVSWEMPTDIEKLIKVHRKFGSPKAIEQQLVRTSIESAAFSTGPLMSSTESAAEKRNDLQQFIQDQAKNGPYRTHTVSVKVIDPLSGQEKTVNAAEILLENGKPVRENSSNVAEFGINLLPITLNHIAYEATIEQQIKKRQEAIQSVQQSQANAQKAEQDAITAEKNGQAKAAEAKWAQETIKAQKVTEAQQQLEVMTLAAKEAELYKNKQILIGQGDAERKRLEMQANGALDQKLAAYVEIQKAYAQAISDYKGNWVPQVVTGGNGQSVAGSGANQLIDLLGVKAAKDLAIDLSIEKK